MGSSHSARLKRPRVRLSNAITGATFEHPEAITPTVDHLREDRAS